MGLLYYLSLYHNSCIKKAVIELVVVNMIRVCDKEIIELFQLSSIYALVVLNMIIVHEKL